MMLTKLVRVAVKSQYFWDASQEFNDNAISV